MESESGNNCAVSFAFIHCHFHEVLETLLQEWRKDPVNKVLIFTKSVKLLEMLEHHLKGHRKESCQPHITQLTRSRIDHKFVKLDGPTKQEDREHARSVPIARC